MPNKNSGEYVFLWDGDEIILFSKSHYTPNNPKSLQEKMDLFDPKLSRFRDYSLSHQKRLDFTHRGEIKNISYTDFLEPLIESKVNLRYMDIPSKIYRVKPQVSLVYSKNENLDDREKIYVERIIENIKKFKTKPNNLNLNEIFLNRLEYTKTTFDVYKFINANLLRDNALTSEKFCQPNSEPIGELKNVTANYLESNPNRFKVYGGIVDFFPNRHNDWKNEFNGENSFYEKINDKSYLNEKALFNTIMKSLYDFSNEFSDEKKLEGLLGIMLNDPNIDEEKILNYAIDNCYKEDVVKIDKSLNDINQKY
jgi:hypothetical protein